MSCHASSSIIYPTKCVARSDRDSTSLSCLFRVASALCRPVAGLQLSSSPLTPACIDSRRQRNEEDVPTPCGLRPSSPTRSVRRPCAEHRGNLRQPQASFAPPSLNLSPQCESRRPQFAYRLEIFLVFGLDFVEAFVFYFDFLGWI